MPAAISLAGAAVGVGGGFIAIRFIQRVPDLVGVFQPDYTADVFGRALGIAVGMAFVGALYPATERVGGSDQAVRGEGECDGLDVVVDAACPKAMLRWTTEKGARVANPAPWPACRVLAIWAFDGAP